MTAIEPSGSPQYRVAGALLLGLLMISCTSAPRVQPVPPPNQRAGAVEAQPLLPDDSARYRAMPGMHYEQPEELPGNPPPRYPDALLGKSLPPAEVRVRVVVDSNGVVTQVDALDPTTLPEAAAFLEATRTAVMAWRYFPLAEVVPGPERPTFAVGNVTLTYRGRAKRLPFHLDYAFHFRQIDGKGVVDSESTPSH